MPVSAYEGYAPARLLVLHLAHRIQAVERYTSRADEFDSPRGETRWDWAIRREGWAVRTCTRTVLTATPTAFRIRANLDAYEDDERVYCRNWDVTIPRDLV